MFQAKQEETIRSLFTTIYALSLKGGVAFEKLRVRLQFSPYTFSKGGSCFELRLYHVDDPNYHIYSMKHRDKTEKEIQNLGFKQVSKDVRSTYSFIFETSLKIIKLLS